MDLTCPACCAAGRPHSLVAEQRYRLVRCLACRSQYFRPDERLGAAVDEPAVSEYWESYKFDLYGSAMVQAAFDARYDRVLDQVRQHASPLHSVLDVGCGVGNFLAHAEATGLRTVGCDVDAKAVQVARERGLTACVADELDELVPDESVDAASMWDVVEHLYDPLSVLRQVVAKVRPGGALMFETPDAAFPIRPVLLGLHQLTGGWVHLAAPMYYWEHKIYFTEAGLRRLLCRVGVDLVWLHRETSLREKMIVEFAYDRDATRLGRVLARAWPALESTARRLGRGNKLLLIGRKRG